MFVITLSADENLMTVSQALQLQVFKIHFPPRALRDESTNSWTTIIFIEGLARNIRRTLSVSIRNACFYWIIPQVVSQSFPRKASLKFQRQKLRRLYLVSSETLRKRNHFQKNFRARNDHLIELDHVNVRKRLQKKSS